MHPLIDNFDEVSTPELEHKIADLQKKYFMTSNYSLQQQILTLLAPYKEEIHRRQIAELDRIFKSKNKDFNSIIHVQK